MAHEGVPATPAIYELAEGILWDDRASLVRWVDIWKGRVHAAALRDGRLDLVDTLELGQTTGAVALAEDGGLLLAAARGLATVSPAGVVSVGPNLLGDRSDVRFNDGSVDPQGRFVVGTLALSAPTTREILLRVQADGALEVLREGVGLSNGIAFSPDGGTIYHVDTVAGTVASHSYGPGRFDADEPWLVLLDDLPAAPDGLTVDSMGTLWVAHWGGSCVRAYSPGGELLDQVVVDAVQVSCAAFVGPDLDVLAITTAQEGLDAVTDLAGTIFLARTGAVGLPVPRWVGSTTTPYWTTDQQPTDTEKERA